MTTPFATAMRRALDQTRAGDPAEATRILQAALGGLAPDPGPTAWAGTPGPTRLALPTPPRADPDADDAVTLPPRAALADRPAAPTPPRAAPPRVGPVAVPSSLGPRLAAVLDLGAGGLRGRAPGGLAATGLARPGGDRDAPGAAIPHGARYDARAFACAHGARDYRLYVPAALPQGPRGLVMMLHGCTQTPDDFATGTAMNAVAERHGLIVVYPAQPTAHNASGCWNWFRPGDQARGAGEPAILAALARAVAAEFAVPPAAVFAAGLSAGGAMAAVLGATYPDVFAAVGVHSGLPCGAARDVVSAFAAMRGDPGPAAARGGPAPALGGGAGFAALGGGSAVDHAGAPARARPVRTIVFHGTADATVHPANAGRIVAAASPGAAMAAPARAGTAPGGRRYTVAATLGPDGAPGTELWLVEGAGHAWSGGAAPGSYTDPRGPDASAEMVRFFLARPSTAAPER